MASVPGLLADFEWDTRNVLLTLARIWITLETGEIRAKVDGTLLEDAIARPVTHTCQLQEPQITSSGEE